MYALETEEIRLHNKADFDLFLELHNPKISELTFTNLFAWRHLYNFRFTVIDGLLCIISVPRYGKPFAMMPVGNLNGDNFAKAYISIMEYFAKQSWEPIFKKITADELIYFKNMKVPETAFEFDRDNSDYLYDTKDLITLGGKKYDGKRNHINRFNRQHTYEYVALEDSLVHECIRIMDEWCEDKDCDCENNEQCERLANLEILQNYNTLGCKGAIIKVDGVFEAFTVGEMLNNDTAVIHIEKAKSNIDGLYTLINQQFVLKEWSEAAFINREQDLGKEGMRKAKLSYHPTRLIEKYTVYSHKE